MDETSMPPEPQRQTGRIITSLVKQRQLEGQIAALEARIREAKSDVLAQELALAALRTRLRMLQGIATGSLLQAIRLTRSDRDPMDRGEDV